MGHTTINGEHLGAVVVNNHAAAHLVVQRRAQVTAQLRLFVEFHGVGATVVFDAFALAFNELIQPFTLLTERREFAGLGRDQAILVAIGVLAHFNAGAPDQNRAFGQHDTAGEHAGFLGVVITQGIGFHIHGLVAVGLFSSNQAYARRQGRQQKHSGK